MRLTLIVFATTAIFTNVLLASTVKGQKIEEVTVEIGLHGERLTDVFKKIENQTPFTFVYRNEDVSKINSLYLKDSQLTVKALLEQILAGSSLNYRQLDRRILITAKTTENNTTPEKYEESLYLEKAPKDSVFTLIGKVLEAKTGLPIPGANISGKTFRASSDKNGIFKISVKKGDVIRISYIGFDPKEITIQDATTLTISLQESIEAMKEVVVNGLFTRKAESFTGSVATFSGAELKRVGNVNVLKSLAILDPSFQLVDNLQFGSDPNKLPEVILRGPTGVPDLSLNAQYSNAPNLPLFILDGFETTVQKVYDLNMNMIASITLLKDASAKAIYGSKAGNGVVVIETLRPAAGNIRVSYTGSLDVTAPDLSSYHMTNSLQKIQAEVLAGKYVSPFPENQFPLTQQYSINQELALSGINTDWLSLPLQNGIGQKHNLYVDGGTEAMRYSAGINYNDVTGVMKGSDRQTISGLVNLQYRKKNVAFSNNLSIDQNKAVNSPYGDFGDYTKMNPYWQPYDANGKLIPSYAVLSAQIYNPLYDASLNTKDNSSYTNITENFYGEWEAMKNLRFTAKVGISTQNNGTEYFMPANATKYINISPFSDEYLNRGEYTITNGKSTNISSDIGGSYSFQLGKNQLFTNLLYSIQQTSSSVNGMTMVGFPNDKLDDISLGRQYQTGSRATGTENTARNMGVTSAINYSYDNRYLADVSIRANASSQFGANKRWGTFWSTGLGWNMHHENFMKSLAFVNQFKIRGSIGSSGTQNFSSYQAISSYNYVTDATYNGDLGLKLLALANPNLKWQQVLDKNVGIDAGLFNKINFTVDYYISDTKDLLSDQTVAPSTGFPSYKDNVGETRNQGFQFNISSRLYNNTTSGTYVTIFANVAHNTNKIRKVSNSLTSINNMQDEQLTSGGEDGHGTSKPLTRFAEGQSMSAIWAVPSLGIDPENGKEIFVKQDGSLTNIWSAADQVVVGDATPKYSGSFGTNIQIKKLTINFAFSYRLGGQLYNQTLVDKVENADINYNVDVRLLQGRWKNPGDQSLYKDITDFTVTQPSSRFVQNNSELLFSSVNIGYDFSKLKFVKNLKMSSLSATLNANDLGRIGTVRTEHGLDYPFARTISLSLQANF